MANASFSVEELQTSLSEVSWGLTSYQVLPAQFSPPNEARARLELLEDGDSAVVGVGAKGWNVCLRSVSDYSRLPADSAAQDTQTFETLDHLLAYLSPAFESRRIQQLSDKLANISVRRSWGEDEGELKEGILPEVEASVPSEGAVEEGQKEA